MSGVVRSVVRLDVDMTEEEALALAQFVKRVGFADCRGNAVDTDEAYLMIRALDRLRGALALAGWSPR